MRAKPAVLNGAPRSETNMNGDGSASRRKAAQCPHLTAGQGMGAGRAIFGPTDVQDSLSEINLILTHTDHA